MAHRADRIPIPLLRGVPRLLLARAGGADAAAWRHGGEPMGGRGGRGEGTLRAELEGTCWRSWNPETI
eukprot:gene9479-biopygen5927